MIPARQAKTPKTKKKKASPRVSSYYELDGDNVIRKKQFCKRCGPGYFLADMYDRYVCGKCGYTEFKKQQTKKTSSK